MAHPKIIYCEIDEEITSIFDRIKHLRQRIIYLVVPNKAGLLQSQINLKILYSKTNELDKKIIIVSQDPIGTKLALQANFVVIDKIEPYTNKDKKNNTYSTLITAESNKLNKDTPILRTEKKITIKELIESSEKFLTKDKKNNTPIKKDTPAIRIPNPSRKSVLAIILASIFVFTFISYVALPGAKILIKPKSNIIKQPVNITLVDAKKNQDLLSTRPKHTLPFYVIENVFEKRKQFTTVSQKFEGSNSKGQIKIINSSAQEWPLLEKTQFVSPDGIIYRTISKIVVPSKKGDKNGELIAEVIADPFDIYQNPVGDRGNIGPSVFKIRKLSEYNQNLIWGESLTPMEGGITVYSNILTEEDLEKAKLNIESEMIDIAKTELENYIEDQNNINNSSLTLIQDEQCLEKEILEIKLPHDLVGQEVESFDVYLKIRVKSLAFNYDNFIAILKNDLKSRVHPDMRLREDLITKDSFNYQIIDENKALGHIKLSILIRGIQEYNFDPLSPSGERLANKIKQEIIDKTIVEAENYVSNLNEVEEVKISVWPFWSSTIPKVVENINILLM